MSQRGSPGFNWLRIVRESSHSWPKNHGVRFGAPSNGVSFRGRFVEALDRRVHARIRVSAPGFGDGSFDEMATEETADDPVVTGEIDGD